MCVISLSEDTNLIFTYVKCNVNVYVKCNKYKSNIYVRKM